jgi:hypothetical protein
MTRVWRMTVHARTSQRMAGIRSLSTLRDIRSALVPFGSLTADQTTTVEEHEALKARAVMRCRVQPSRIGLGPWH